MNGRYDFSKTIATLTAEPAAVWDVTLPVSWAAINSFSDDLDSRLAAAARAAGVTLWSEDSGATRTYHLNGRGDRLLRPVTLLQADLQQQTSHTFRVWGGNSWVAQMQAAISSRCNNDGVGLNVTRYETGWRSSTLVMTVTGPVGVVADLLRDVNDNIRRAQGDIPRPKPPTSAPIQRPAPPRDIGLSA